MFELTENKIESCRSTRAIAAKTLYVALSKLLSKANPISEVTLRDAWLGELKKENTIFVDGWYVPPPHGIAILFGNRDNKRLNYDNLRSREMWPQEDVFLDRKNGLAYVFASPVHKETGMIGDFGMTLYFGSDVKVQNLLKKILQINREIEKSIKPEQKLSDIYHNANIFLQKAGYKSNVVSVRDKGRINIGHTIPFLPDEVLTKTEEEITSTISKSRVFISSTENLNVQPGMAFTVEPRPRSIPIAELSYLKILAIFLGWQRWTICRRVYKSSKP